MSDYIAQLSSFFAASAHNLPFMLKFLAGLWLFNIINWFLLRSQLDNFGIYPRSLTGLIGIIFAPFLHLNFNHLFFNTIPLFVLGMFILGLSQELFISVSIEIALLQGLLVWLFGRKYLHIGASGVISGYFGFLLALAYLSPSVISVLLAVVAIYYFGAIIAGIFPSKEAVSWESHLFGLIAGLAINFLVRI